jgi:hypothetical protein
MVAEYARVRVAIVKSYQDADSDSYMYNCAYAAIRPFPELTAQQQLNDDIRRNKHRSISIYYLNLN